MADAADQPNKSAWTGGTPPIRLADTTLPENPKRVVRTYASDLAALKNVPQDQKPKLPVPVAAAPKIEPPKADLGPIQMAPIRAPEPPRVRTQPQAQPLPAVTHGSLQQAIGNMMPAERPEPVQPPPPPPQPKPAPMYVRRPEAVPPPIPLRKAQPDPVEEAVVYENKPSLLTRILEFFFPPEVPKDIYVPPPPASAPAAPVPPPPPPPKPVPPPVPKPLPPPAPKPVPPPPPPLPMLPPPPPPAPIPPPPPQPPAPPAYEAPIGSLIPSTSATEDAKTREEVLARLRTRVATYQTDRPVPPPVFPTPKPEAPARRAAPSAWAPPDFGSLAIPASDRLHTFGSDFSDKAKRTGASRISVYAEQADAARGPAPVAKSRHGLAYALMATVLFVGGSLVLYFAYTYFIAQSPVPIISSAPAALISGDDDTTITGTGSELMGALMGVTNANIPVGNIRLVYLSVASTTSLGTVTVEKPGGDLIAALQLPAPSILLRNVGENSTVGVVHAREETRVFFILAANSYERTFAGMLSWEATIGRDLAALYPAYETFADATTTSSTSSGQAATTTPFAPTAPPQFVDEVVQSHDVRALKDSTGRTILLYGYRDQHTLIIARDETAFAVLLARLSATQ